MCVVVVTADAGAALKLVFVIHGTLLIYCVNAHIFGNAIFALVVGSNNALKHMVDLSVIVAVYVCVFALYYI